MKVETKNNLIVISIIIVSLLLAIFAVGFELLKVAALIKWILT
jgi:hypothetical protein